MMLENEYIQPGSKMDQLQILPHSCPPVQKGGSRPDQDKNEKVQA